MPVHEACKIDIVIFSHAGLPTSKPGYFYWGGSASTTLL